MFDLYQDLRFEHERITYIILSWHPLVQEMQSPASKTNIKVQLYCDQKHLNNVYLTENLNLSHGQEIQCLPIRRIGLSITDWNLRFEKINHFQLDIIQAWICQRQLFGRETHTPARQTGSLAFMSFTTVWPRSEIWTRKDTSTVARQNQPWIHQRQPFGREISPASVRWIARFCRFCDYNHLENLHSTEILRLNKKKFPTIQLDRIRDAFIIYSSHLAKRRACSCLPVRLWFLLITRLWLEASIVL